MQSDGELSAHIRVSSPVRRTARVMQLEGLFDIPPSERAELSWDVRLPLHERPWHVGLIVGPSGSGKSTIARELFGPAVVTDYSWPEDMSILDAFPASMGIKDVVALLSSVGFSSPPSWLRPYQVLSTGEQFRVRMARLLAEQPDLAVADEFTSVVDRTVAQIGSAAIAKTIRRREQRFIAVTCHFDVEEWLDPDWVYRPDLNQFTWRSLRGRPAITLQISRVPYQVWAMFRQHHYLSHDLNHSAVCFAAFWQDQPVAFSAWLPFLHRSYKHTKRASRTVTLPDFQGVGIGNALSNYTASLWRGLGYRAISTTGHPAMIHARAASPLWRMHKAPGFNNGSGGMMDRDPRLKKTVASTRLTAGFEYVGPALPRDEATRVLGCWAGA